MIEIWKTTRPLVLLAALLVPSLARSAAPRDELLRLVPGDVGFCLLVEDLRGHAAAFLRSPFLGALRASPLGAKLGPDAPEMQKLAEVDQFLQQHLHVSLNQLRDDLLGDAVVFAYRPGPPGQTEQEQELILVHARDAKLLAAVLDRLDEAQRESGELKELTTHEHKGTAYRRRVQLKETDYHYRRGPVLAISHSEAMIRRAVELDRGPANGESSAARQFRQLGGEGRLVRLWLNPRAFEPELRHKLTTVQGAEATVLKTFSTYWQALDSIGLSLGLDADLELALTVRARTNELPPAAQRFLAAAAAPSALLSRFPDDTLFAAAGRLDVAALAETFNGFLNDEVRRALRTALDQLLGQALGEELLKQVIPALGPDVGLFVAAPPAADPNGFPHAVAAVRVRPGDGAIPADVAMSNVLNAVAMLAVVDHNRKNKDQVKLRTIMQDGVEVRYLMGEPFPHGFRPAFALKDGYLLLATSPEALRRFRAVPAVAQAEMPMVRFSPRALVRYLGERREAVVAHAAEKNQISKDEAGKQLHQFLEVLQLFDTAELACTAEEGRGTLSLRVRTSRPLR